MRRWIVLGILVLGITIDVLGGSNSPARAAEDRVIPVHLSSGGRGGLGSKVGDSCIIAIQRSEELLVPRSSQIVITNESGTVIAVQDLYSTLEASSGDEESLSCNVDVEIGVPEASFYNVYIDDTKITTIRSDQFPLGEGDVVWIIAN